MSKPADNSRKRKGREDEPDELTEEKMSDVTTPAVVARPATFENSYTHASKGVHRERHTSRDFFTATLEWAELPSHVARLAWDEHNSEFMCCQEHLRLTDNWPQADKNGCAQCGYTGSETPLIAENAPYHHSRYPMLVEYKPNDEQGREKITHMWNDAFATVRAAQDVYQDAEGSATKEQALDVYTKAAKHHTITIAYKQYAWCVADEVRQEWKASGVMKGDRSRRQVTMPPPEPNSREGFMEGFCYNMLEYCARGSSSRMWCMEHNCLGDWLPIGCHPERYLSCGFCRAAPIPTPAELENQRIQATKQ